MKMWKRLAAAVLAAVLAMAMLTACGGDLAGVMRDEETEATVAKWVQQYMSKRGYTVRLNDDMDRTVNKAMSTAVAMMDAEYSFNKFKKERLEAQLQTIVVDNLSGVKTCGGYLGNRVKGSVTQTNVNAALDRDMDEIVRNLNGAKPGSFAVGVTRKEGYIYYFIIISY